MRAEILGWKNNQILKRPKIRILHYNSYPTATDPNPDPDKVQTRTQKVGCSYPLFGMGFCVKSHSGQVATTQNVFTQSYFEIGL